ncbi:MAG TPA: TetR family transcriptional regulator [Pseudonocardia sp.]|nr:TetR family transcriptional regulator [Pseudonocardia sp.]
MFVDHGVEGTSIEQVVHRAGVGELTAYRRWASEESSSPPRCRYLGTLYRRVTLLPG